ncbi:MAG TPA: hypothetical protein V6D20_05785, partial [Candidatus Obscuribacterales bacterium]
MITLPFLKLPGFTPTSCLTVAAIGSAVLMPLADAKDVDKASQTAEERLSPEQVVEDRKVRIIELVDPKAEGRIQMRVFFDGRPAEVEVQVEPIAKEEVAPEPAKPVEGREIVRPIGRVAPVEEAEPQTEAIPEKHAEHKEV